MRIVILSGLLFIASSIPAFSQQIGDAVLGQQFAELICSTCHAVHPSQIKSTVDEATPFQIVADAPGMTANALTAWLQTSHPTMPNIILYDDDMRNVIQYILSLRTR